MEPCRACFDLNPSNALKYADPYSDTSAGVGELSFTVLLARLNAQKQEGCPICGLLSKGVTFFGSRSKQWEPDRVKLRILAILSKPLQIKAYIGSEILTIEFCTSGETQSGSLDYLGPARKVLCDSWSHERRDLIKGWIENCIFGHENCETPDPKFWPKRVLDVEDGQICLREMVNFASGKYIALSHRWPKGSVPKTTKANHDARKLSLPLADLTLTYREAVEVTRWLGVQYLWIDSLCIVQDDSLDWEEQSSVMAEIYENAYVTLTARPTIDGKSCLRHHPDETSFEADLRTGDGKFEVLARPFHEHDFLYRSDGRADIYRLSDVDNVSARGWCFQERVLSNRILHLTPSEMIFECADSMACECRFHCDHGISGSESLLKARWRERRSGHAHDPDRLRLWKEIVETFSCKRLTYETDVLPALSGISKRMSSCLLYSTQYLAGIWVDCLPYHLAWETFPHIGIRRERYVAPSFSWASLRGGCRFPCSADHYNTSAQKVELLEAGCVSRGKNLWGEVSHGHITLRGLFVSAEPREVASIGPPGNGRFRCTIASAVQFFDLSVDTEEDATWLSETKSFHLIQLFGVPFSTALVLAAVKGNTQYRRIGLAANVDSTIFSAISKSEIMII